MQLSAEEVKMSAKLIVPTGFGFIGNGLLHLLIILSCVLHRHVALCHGSKALANLALLAAENIGKHLYVISSRAESLAYHGIHITATAKVAG